MVKKSKFKEEFLDALEKNLFLTKSNKKKLLLKFDSLPERALKDLFRMIKDQNDQADKYITIALEDDPTLIKEMVSLVKRIKKKIVHLKESEEKGGLEELLEEELNNV